MPYRFLFLNRLAQMRSEQRLEAVDHAEALALARLFAHNFGIAILQGTAGLES